MNATNTLNVRTTRHEFDVEHDGAQYAVVIHCDRNEKFIDDSITLNGIELDSEGEQGDLREQILDYISGNWDKLVND